MNEATIWSYLKAQGLSDAGIAGMMGNLYAESGLSPINLQNTYEKTLGYTDEGYTAAVDSGAYTNFIYDAAGYGLCQWTFRTRKEGLLKAAKAAGVSVGNLEIQLAFLMQELTAGYSGLLSLLKSTNSIREASDAVMTQFERPANQSERMKSLRASYGQKYYTQFGGQGAVTEKEVQPVTVRIAHATGGDPTYTPGNQTGSELREGNWYSGGWTVLLRPKSSTVAEAVASAAEKGVRNRNIGYGQGDRNTARAQAKLHNMRLDLIDRPCNCDCSSFVSLCAECAGVIGEAQYTYGNAPFTGNMRQKFYESGNFEVLTDLKYLTSQDYLKRGDILVNEPQATGHAVVIISNGAHAGSVAATSGGTTGMSGTGGKVCPYAEPTAYVRYGSVGEGAKWVQWQLNRHGASLEVDGEFGTLSRQALMVFQTVKGLEVDGICGPESRRALKA